MSHTRSSFSRASCDRDVNSAVDYVFQNNVSLSSGSGGGSAASSSNYNLQAAQALFDGFKTTNDMGEVVMGQEAIESFMG